MQPLLQVVTAKGVVLSQLYSKQRAPEVHLIQFCLEKLGIPILGQIPPPGKLEGGDFLPAGKVCLAAAAAHGTGLRALGGLLPKGSIDVGFWLTSNGEGGGWHKASVLGCLPLAAPMGLWPVLILTLCGSERVLVVSREPLDDLSCLTTLGVGCPGDGLLPGREGGGGMGQELCSCSSMERRDGCPGMLDGVHSVAVCLTRMLSSHVK